MRSLRWDEMRWCMISNAWYHSFGLCQWYHRCYDVIYNVIYMTIVIFYFYDDDEMMISCNHSLFVWYHTKQPAYLWSYNMLQTGPGYDNWYVFYHTLTTNSKKWCCSSLDIAILNRKFKVCSCQLVETKPW